MEIVVLLLLVDEVVVGLYSLEIRLWKIAVCKEVDIVFLTSGECASLGIENERCSIVDLISFIIHLCAWLCAVHIEDEHIKMVHERLHVSVRCFGKTRGKVKNNALVHWRVHTDLLLAGEGQHRNS